MTSAPVEGGRPPSAVPVVAVVILGVAAVSFVGSYVGLFASALFYRFQQAGDFYATILSITGVVQMALTYAVLYVAVRFAARSRPAVSAARWSWVGLAAYGLALALGAWLGLRVLITAVLAPGILLLGLQPWSNPVLLPVYALDALVWWGIAYLAAWRARVRAPSANARLG